MDEWEGSEEAKKDTGNNQRIRQMERLLSWKPRKERFCFFFKMSFSSALRPVKMEGGKCAANQAWMLLKVLEQFSSRVI